VRVHRYTMSKQLGRVRAGAPVHYDQTVRPRRAEVGEVRGLVGRVAAAEDGRGGHAGGPPRAALIRWPGPE